MKLNIQNTFYLIFFFVLTACSGSGGDPGGPRNPKADLASLDFNTKTTLDDNFQPDQMVYMATVNFNTSSIKITPEVLNPGSTVTINSQPVTPGTASETITLAHGSSNIVDIVVTASDNSISSTYSIDIVRLDPSSFNSSDVLRLTSNPPNAKDAFGSQISISGDTLAVGVPSTLNNAAGSVYIYERTNNNFWGYKTTITASNADNADKFGSSISLSGHTLIVGAPFEDSKSTGVNGNQFDEDIIDNPDGSTSEGNIGAAYVYKRVPGTTDWIEQAYLKPSSPIKNINRNILFGSSVAADGDTVAVSAKFEKGDASGVNNPNIDRLTKAGAVFVFTRNGSSWTQQAYIKASNTGQEDRFGSSLSLSGDSLAVGARFEDSNATGINGDQSNNGADGSGAVYVFTRTGSTWSQQAYVKASNTESGERLKEDQFGFSVAIDGDTLAVGSKNEDSYGYGVATVEGVQEDNSVPNSGAVYIYKRNAGNWSQEAYLKSANSEIAGNFGWSVALSGDMLAVGAPGEEFASGTVHFFTRSGSDWSQQDPKKVPHSSPRPRFGISVELDSGTLAGSSPEADDGKGAVFLFR